ncbi:MAG: AMP-binding protein [Gemmatimonadota bacterium]|nr:AMP-binding protein [Gemmatimonadota bacterium]
MTDHPWFRHYDAGVPRTLGAYPARTLLDYVDDAVAARPEAPALLFKGRTVTWRELQDASDAFAGALASLGVARGDRVAVLLPNCPQFFIVELAAWKLGATLVPLNPIYDGDELATPLQTTGARVAVVLTAFHESLKAVQGRTQVEHAVLTSIKEWFPPLLRLVFTVAMEKRLGHRATAQPGDRWMQDLLSAHAGHRPAATRSGPGDDALLLMSGGTTGTPKAVRVHHGGLVQTGLQFRAWLSSILPEWEGVYCVPLPAFHSYVACGVQTACFIGHNPMALIPNPRDTDDMVRTIERTKPSVFCGVPTLYTNLLQHKRVAAGKVDFRSMKVCASGAAPLMAETHREFRRVTGARILEGYALTESVLAATVWPIHGPEKVGSVGVPLPDCEVRIADADDPDRPMPTGEVGEVMLRGPQIMRGYFNPPPGTDEILHTYADGTRWLRTADLGYLDEDGYLFVVDRKKDLIKMGGMQVWPREIEEVLATHPAVLEVGVRGFPDQARGEVAVAFVVRRIGRSVTTNELRAWCKDRLAPYKVPARVEFRRELPKSMIGKVLRRMLASLVLAVGAAAFTACTPGRVTPRPAQRVLLISLDGFRWDYVDRPAAVRLRQLASRGVRAERMVPAFPSKTFPNHYTLVTGLTPEQHGIVANAMRDSVLGLFRLSDSLAQAESRWWGGEPIWVTAEQQGRRAATLFWPGSEAAIEGVRPTWWEHYEHTRPHAARVLEVLDWLALPSDSAPAFIGLYFPDADDAGHTYGPLAPQVDSAIARLDSAVGAIVDGITRLGLTDVVDVIIVADHGMTETSAQRAIVLDDYLDLATVDVIDWTPVAAIAPRAGDEERVYRALAGKHPHLQVYRKGKVPARWHFNANPRITPIVAVADEGWTITSRAQVERWREQGWAGGATHGYDPALPSMGAVFIAAGPGIARGKVVPPFGNVHVYALMAELLGLRPARTSGSLDSVRAILR